MQESMIRERVDNACRASDAANREQTVSRAREAERRWRIVAELAAGVAEAWAEQALNREPVV